MAGHWADASVAKAVELGLFKGASAAVFSPDRTILRAELVTALFRLYESKTGVKDESKACTLVFTDVSCNSWYLPAVNWAVEKNVVKGSDRRFRPNDPVTREELTAILYRFDALLRGKSADTDARTLASAASDAASVSSWAVGSMIHLSGPSVSVVRRKLVPPQLRQVQRPAPRRPACWRSRVCTTRPRRW